MSGIPGPGLRRIWSGHRSDPLSLTERLLYLALIPISVLYASITWARRACYRMGLLRSRSVPGILVVSVGNITVGGTGKSPLAIGIARGLMEREVPVAVVSRGYGGAGRGRGPLLVSDGSGPLVGPSIAGDEPVMIARAVPVPVIVSADRYLGARLAKERFGAQVVILDDGFQHRALARDADIVLLDAADPFGNRWTLPAGRLREPLSALGDADLFFFVNRGTDGVRPIPERLKGLLAAFSPGSVVMNGVLAFRSVRRAGGGALHPVDWLSGRRVLLVSGVAAPDPFEQEVQGRGGIVVAHLAYGDHHAYTPADVDHIAEVFAASDAQAVLTTAKDEVKLMESGLGRRSDDVWVAETGYDPGSIDLLVSALAGGE